MIEMVESANVLLEGVFVPLLIVELVVLLGFQKLGWARVKEMLGNTATFLLFIPAGLAGVFLWTKIFAGVESVVPWAIPLNVWTLLLAILVADFIYYWEHRWGHELRLLWDLYHSVHHSSPQYDQTTSLRLGIFDGLLSLAFSLPMVMLGFSTEVALITTSFVVAYQTWLHTELIQKMPRWFEAVFNTPSHHRVHHGSTAPYLDVNYGGLLIIWDKLFGTFQAEEHTPIYGLTKALESSNPIDIQFAGLRSLWRDLKSDTTWRDRMFRLWKHPGWQPRLSEPQK